MKKLYIFLAVALFISTAVADSDQGVGVQAEDINIISRTTTHKPLVESDLYIFTLLNYVKTSINSTIEQNAAQAEQDSDQTKSLMSVSNIVDDAINLFSRIVQDLNDRYLSYNPLIELKFVKMCNCLQELDPNNIAPHNLRIQYQAVKEFNQFITLYSLNNKNALKPEDLELFDRMTMLNQALMLCVLKKDHFNIDFIDVIFDYMFYQPLEFMGRNKLLVGIVLLIAIVAITYFYIYPRFYENLNKKYSVVPEYGIHQGTNQCGFVSLAHALIYRNATDDADAERMIKKANEIGPKLVAPLEEKLGVKNNDDRWINGAQIEELMHDQQCVNHIMQQVGGRAVKTDNIIVADILPSSNVSDGDLAAFASPETSLGAELLRCKAALNNQQAQNVILRVPDGRYPHWVNLNIKHDDTKPYGIAAKLINSINVNYTGDAQVTALLDRLVQK